MKRTAYAILILILLTNFTLVFANNNILGDDLLFSKDNFLRYFNDHENLEFIESDGIKMMYMKELPDVSYTVLSKEEVTYDEYTYSVTLAAKTSTSRDFKEIPIVLGMDKQNLNGHQVFISRRPNNIALRYASKTNGLFNTTFETGLDYMLDDDLFFTITIQVSGSDANLFLNYEYITTISADTDFKGYLGVRCSNPIVVQEIKLFEGIVDLEAQEAEPTEETQETPSPEPAEATKAPLETSTLAPSETPNEEPTEKKLSSALIGGIVLGLVILVCVALVLVVLKKKKK